MTLRARLLQALAAQPVTTPDLAHALGAPRDSVWRTLRRMERAGLVRWRRIWAQTTGPVAWEVRG